MPEAPLNSTTLHPKRSYLRYCLHFLLLLTIVLQCSNNPARITSYAEVILIPENGAISPVGAFTVPIDSIIVPTITPYTNAPFATWVISGNIETIGSPDNPTSTFRIKGNGTITASFRPANQFVIEITQPPNATITKSPDKPFYQKGEVVTLTVNPTVGYQLRSWIGGASGNANPTSVTIKGSTTVSATLSEIPGVAGVVYVCKAATGANNGSNWTNAYTELSTALNAATTAKDIWVARGVYKPTNNSTPLSTHADTIRIFGGFNGFEFAYSSRIFKDHFTELDGTGASTLMNVQNAGFYMSGCVIRNAGSYGLFITKSNAIIEDCIFRSNTGTAVHFENLEVGSLTGEQIRRCVFHSNTAPAGYGYGVAVTNSNYVRGTVIVNSIFTGNTNGPAICDFNASRAPVANLTSIYNCTIVNNRSGSTEPGGFHCTGNARIKGSIFYFNTRASGAGSQIDSTYMVDSCDIQNWSTTGIAKRDVNNWNSRQDINPNFISNTIPASDALWYSTADNVNFLPRAASLRNNYLYDQKPLDDLRGKSRGQPTTDKSDLGAYEY